MQVALSLDFTGDLAGVKSPGDRKTINEAVRKFLQNPANPGLSLERVERGRSTSIWTARVNDDYRLVLHKAGGVWTVLRVMHHDDAYRLAESIRLDPHGTTGAIQVVYPKELYETAVAAPAEELVPEPPLARFGIDYLLSLGLPEEAVAAVHRIASEDDLIEMGLILPPDVWERLYRLWLGEEVSPPRPIAAGEEPLRHPDVQRQFVLIQDDEELERIVEAPWAQWLTFLHPLQREAAHGRFSGPSKVTGAAGTGKTVVAIHRACELARRGHKVLLTTFTRALAGNLESSLGLLATQLERSRIKVATTHAIALELATKAGKRITVLPRQDLGDVLQSRAKLVSCPRGADFLLAEWERVIVPRGITTWEQYQRAPREGRGIPLRAQERLEVWKVIELVQQHLRSHGQVDFPGLCALARELVETGAAANPFQAVVVDEVQDLGVQELLLLKALGGLGPDGLTFVGDAGQRIYASRASLRSLGIEVRGRSRLLRVSYRTSREIRRFAEGLIGLETDDIDGSTESRTGTLSLFSGPLPELHRFRSDSEQADTVAEMIAGRVSAGAEPGSMGVFAREKKALQRVQDRLTARGVPTTRLRENSDLQDLSHVRLGTMHSAKGLEFRVVFVVDLNASVLPHPKALAVEDPMEMQEAIELERQLLYVAITRARQEVHLCYHGKLTVFLRESGTETAAPEAP